MSSQLLPELANIKKLIKKVVRLFLRVYIEIRWWLHHDRSRVPTTSLSQYKHIFSRALMRTKQVPNIFYGSDYNNKIRWLMIFDQNPLIIQCSDKLAVREYVRKRVGSKYLSTIYATYQDAKEINFEKLPESFVLKTNHDSGSVWLVPRKSRLNQQLLRDSVSQSLQSSYGYYKGEWAYQYIEPRAFAEELLSGGDGGIPDFKFHCVAGSVCFVHYIYDRLSTVKKDIILDPNGSVTEFRLDDDFIMGSGFSCPPQWQEMRRIAETLSNPFKYVSVDLYLAKEEIRFGELTFYPRNGNKRGKDIKVLGQLLRLDRETTRPAYRPTLSTSPSALISKTISL